MTDRVTHTMISRLLVANRGEIARRVIETAHRLGVQTVAVFSDADADAAHVREADAAVRLPGDPSFCPRQSRAVRAVIAHVHLRAALVSSAACARRCRCGERNRNAPLARRTAARLHPGRHPFPARAQPRVAKRNSRRNLPAFGDRHALAHQRRGVGPQLLVAH